MSKILETEFRKDLYKNLVDAGYSKLEAQKIVGTKYYANLFEDVKNALDQLLSEVVKENFDVSVNGDELNGKLTELKKMKELLKE